MLSAMKLYIVTACTVNCSGTMGELFWVTESGCVWSLIFICDARLCAVDWCDTTNRLVSTANGGPYLTGLQEMSSTLSKPLSAHQPRRTGRNLSCYCQHTNIISHKQEVKNVAPLDRCVSKRILKFVHEIMYQILVTFWTPNTYFLRRELGEMWSH